MSQSYVYNGVWINWARGRVLGWTLTLPSAEGQLLIAFLAVFVTVAGARAWFVTSYLIHQLRAGLNPGDQHHQQTQVILRNTGGALVASWELLSLRWPRAKAGSSKFWSVPLLAVLGLLHALGWAVAGVFSSQVVNTAGNEVLIRSPNCGYYESTKNATFVDKTWFQAYRNLNATRDAATYSRLCYGVITNKQFCSQYTVPNIPWTRDVNSTCPFGSDFCRLNGTAAALTMDTAMLNSQSIFGFNTPPSDEVGYRKVTTCAPIRTPNGFSEFVNNTTSNGRPGNDTWLRVYLGPTSHTNWTGAYNVNKSTESYELQTISAMASFDRNAWAPIRQLNLTDADISLFFLSGNAITYHQPVDDPWFSAHTPIDFPPDTYYLADSYMRILGCADRHQFCNPNLKVGKPLCTPLTGSIPAFAAARERRMGFSETQSSIISRFDLTLPLTSTIQSVTSEVSLQAYDSVWKGFSAPLPNTHWQTEAAAWFNIALAKLQALLVEISSGPVAPSPKGLITPPHGPIDAELCNAQKVRRSAGHVSFSVLGLVIIFVVGGTLIIISFIIDIAVGFLQRWSRRGAHKAAQWLRDEKLELQRMVYENAGNSPVEVSDGQVAIATETVQHKGLMYTSAREIYPS